MVCFVHASSIKVVNLHFVASCSFCHCEVSFEISSRNCRLALSSVKFCFLLHVFDTLLLADGHLRLLRLHNTLTPVLPQKLASSPAVLFGEVSVREAAGRVGGALVLPARRVAGPSLASTSPPVSCNSLCVYVCRQLAFVIAVV